MPPSIPARDIRRTGHPWGFGPTLLIGLFSACASREAAPVPSTALDSTVAVPRPVPGVMLAIASSLACSCDSLGLGECARQAVDDACPTPVAPQDLSALRLTLSSWQGWAEDGSGGPCRRPDCTFLIVTMTNLLDRRVLVPRVRFPLFAIVGRPVATGSSSTCSDVARSGDPATFPGAVRLDGILVVEPSGAASIGAQISQAWPEPTPPCETGWYALVAVMEAPPWDRPADVIYSFGPSDSTAPDWASALARLAPSARLLSDFADLPAHVLGACGPSGLAAANPRQPAFCAPANTITDLFGDACIWPCEAASLVVSNEVVVWLDADQAP